MVVGSDGEVLFGPSSVKLKEKEGWGVTALGALEATGVSYEVSKRWPDFVETIAGQRNKDSRMCTRSMKKFAGCCWKKQLAVTTRVIWWYSRSINNPAPVWGVVKSTDKIPSLLFRCRRDNPDWLRDWRSLCQEHGTTTGQVLICLGHSDLEVY